MSGLSTRIITMGSEFFVTAFRFHGIDGFITSPLDFDKLLDIILNDESISLVFLEESLYYSNQDRMDKIKTTVTRPLFIEIPLEKAETERDLIGELIKKDIGIDLELR
ncbi:MAG: V-type ATP synthase subunit F [Promethearchaeota archaeon]